MKTQRAAPPPRNHGGELAALSGPFRSESFASGAAIYHPGDAADRLYLVKGGRVRLLGPGQNGHRPLLALLREGDLFGELAGHAGGVAEELAVASGATVVWSMENRDFRSLLESRPGLAADVVRALDERMRRMRRRLLGLTFKEVPARLCELLLMLGEVHGEPCGHGGEIDLRVVTQQDLADLLGASRSFVSTLVNDLKRDGLLGNIGRTLCLRDLQGLRRLAAKER